MHMAQWLDRMAQRLGLPYTLKIRTLPRGAKTHPSEVMIHAAFQCLIDLCNSPGFRLDRYDGQVQQEIIELCWWWATVRPCRAPLASNDLSEAAIDARVVYIEEDNEMMERLAILHRDLKTL
jgi:hypothetical protein